MASMPAESNEIVGGVDTHQDLHTAAIVTLEGAVLGTESFSTTRAGYRAMLAWFRSHGELLRVGVESTGSYGAGIARHLALSGVPVLEVTGPDRAARRARGKDDALDAVAAAEAARTGCRVQVAKDRGGAVEALRVLRTTRKTAVKCRRAALQQLHNTIVAAPDEVRDQVRNLTRMRRLRICAAWRPDAAGYRDPTVATRLSLKSLARRILDLDGEIAELDRFIAPLVEELAPDLLKLEGVGTASAGELLVTAGENPDRLRSEASFAMLCGACPLPASSGKTRRHRLNRGGNRQANSALHMIVLCRMRTDPRTRTYVERRTGEGLSKREVMRCLKRYWPARSTASSPPHHPLDKHESVRGSPMTAKCTAQLLADLGITQSLSRPRDQGGPDPVAPQPVAPKEARCLRAGLPERHGNDHRRLGGRLPCDDPRRRDAACRPEKRVQPDETDLNKLHDL